MVKRIVSILILFFVFACDSENANDCFQKTGNIVQQEVVVEVFEKILVNREVELILKEGSEQKVVIETGENLLNDVTAIVDNGQLVLTDNNHCNYVRDYDITKVYVTSPNITEIRSSTQYDIRSDGVLTYPSITILSEDFIATDTFSVGDFILEINNDSFQAVFNGLSIAYISGATNSLNVNFAGGDSRFEARALEAQNITIFHRSSNDIIVNPRQSIKGKIVSTGNVISINTPPIIDVETLFNGRLIFE
ncbi:head GIN domain-containing protein [Hyunsoonleella ulvae]|uniref:head GIN domain-containing protein n=1 Tax=Hyunsoonleella ulvae TaxID=2799948 RepID=UPI00193A419C|nr:head GIN domain-containing protein [Hyunsoonleella ulvae]